MTIKEKLFIDYFKEHFFEDVNSWREEDSEVSFGDVIFNENLESSKNVLAQTGACLEKYIDFFFQSGDIDPNNSISDAEMSDLLLRTITGK